MTLFHLNYLSQGPLSRESRAEMQGIRTSACDERNEGKDTVLPVTLPSSFKLCPVVWRVHN